VRGRRGAIGGPRKLGRSRRWFLRLPGPARRGRNEDGSGRFDRNRKQIEDSPAELYRFFVGEQLATARQLPEATKRDVFKDMIHLRDLRNFEVH